MAGLRLYTTAWHVCHQPQQDASGTVVSQELRSVSATKLHRQLNWLQVRQWITYQIVVTTYKTRTTDTPAYLFTWFTTTNQNRHYSLLTHWLFVVPRMTLSLSAKAFSISATAPSVWNSLSHTCNSSCWTTFRHNLKLKHSAYRFPSSRASDLLAI